MTGLPYRKCIKPRLPQRWFDDHPHTHVALDDAIEQGALFCNMLAELRASQAILATHAATKTAPKDGDGSGQNVATKPAN